MLRPPSLTDELAIEAVWPAPTPDDYDEVVAVSGRVFVAVDLNAESQSRGDFKYQCLAGSALAADKAATSGCNSTFFIFHSTFACRLVRVQELCAPTNRHPYTVTYAYDHRGRMVRKDVFCSGNSPFSILHYTFVWDGWNIIRETQWPVTSGQWSVVTDNIWGLDLNGTLQGAGGVGGLLAVIRSNSNSSLCHPDPRRRQLLLSICFTSGKLRKAGNRRPRTVAYERGLTLPYAPEKRGNLRELILT